MSIAEIWSYEFMRYALVSACILGPTCALLGGFVTLRGMSFFSDALAHSAVSGVALGYLVRELAGSEIGPMVFVFFFTVAQAGAMAWLLQRTNLAPDTVIAFSFTGSVALGVVIVSSLDQYRLLDGILFGGIYANGPGDTLRQAVLSATVFSVLLWKMRQCTLATLSSEMARVRGIRTGLLGYLFSLLVAATVTVALPMLGALLLSALIVVPAAAAKLVGGTFRLILFFSLAIGLAAPFFGVVVSC